jgi:hypothetical protein
MAEFNKNFLSPLGFSFTIKKAPAFSAFVQSINIPSVNLGVAQVPTKLHNIPYGGDHLEYGEVSAIFRVNEDMSNYLEIFNWIIGIGFPSRHEQYKELVSQPIETGDGVYSDASLIVYSSAKNPLVKVDFVDLFPISVTDINFTASDTTLEYVECTATFRFTDFKFTNNI